MRRKILHILIYIVALMMVCACSNESIPFKMAEQSYAIGEYYAASINYKKSYSRCKPRETANTCLRF